MAINRVKLEDVINEAKTTLESGDSDRAVALCRHLFKFYPRCLEASRVLGEAYTEKRLLDEADQLFVFVLSADPQDVLGYVDRGFIAYERGKVDDAIMYYERALELDPSIEQLREELLRLYRERFGSGRAKIRLTKAGLANGRLRDGFYGQAIEEYNAVLREIPNRLDVQTGLMEAYWRNRDYPRAERLANELLENHSNLVKANLILWHIYGVRRNQDRAASYLEKAHSLDPLNLLAERLFEDAMVSNDAMTYISMLGVPVIPALEGDGALAGNEQESLVPDWVNTNSETDVMLGLRPETPSPLADTPSNLGIDMFALLADTEAVMASRHEEEAQSSAAQERQDALAGLDELRNQAADGKTDTVFNLFDEVAQPMAFDPNARSDKPQPSGLDAPFDLDFGSSTSGDLSLFEEIESTRNGDFQPLDAAMPAAEPFVLDDRPGAEESNFAVQPFSLFDDNKSGDETPAASKGASFDFFAEEASPPPPQRSQQPPADTDLAFDLFGDDAMLPPQFEAGQETDAAKPPVFDLFGDAVSPTSQPDKEPRFDFLGAGASDNKEIDIPAFDFLDDYKDKKAPALAQNQEPSFDLLKDDDKFSLPQEPIAPFDFFAEEKVSGPKQTEVGAFDFFADEARPSSGGQDNVAEFELPDFAQKASESGQTTAPAFDLFGFEDKSSSAQNQPPAFDLFGGEASPSLEQNNMPAFDLFSEEKPGASQDKPATFDFFNEAVPGANQDNLAAFSLTDEQKSDVGQTNPSAFNFFEEAASTSASSYDAPTMRFELPDEGAAQTTVRELSMSDGPGLPLEPGPEPRPIPWPNPELPDVETTTEDGEQGQSDEGSSESLPETEPPGLPETQPGADRDTALPMFEGSSFQFALEGAALPLEESRLGAKDETSQADDFAIPAPMFSGFSATAKEEPIGAALPEPEEDDSYLKFLLEESEPLPADETFEAAAARPTPTMDEARAQLQPGVNRTPHAFHKRNEQGPLPDFVTTASAATIDQNTTQDLSADTLSASPAAPDEATEVAASVPMQPTTQTSGAQPPHPQQYQEQENDTMPIRRSPEDENDVFDWEREELPDYLQAFAMDEDEVTRAGLASPNPVISDVNTPPARIRTRDDTGGTPGDLPDWLNPVGGGAASGAKGGGFGAKGEQVDLGVGTRSSGGTLPNWLDATDLDQGKGAPPAASGGMEFGGLQPFNLGNDGDDFGGPPPSARPSMPDMSPPTRPGAGSSPSFQPPTFGGPPPQARPGQSNDAFSPAGFPGMDDISPFSLDDDGGAFEAPKAPSARGDSFSGFDAPSPPPPAPSRGGSPFGFGDTAPPPARGGGSFGGFDAPSTPSRGSSGGAFGGFDAASPGGFDLGMDDLMPFGVDDDGSPTNTASPPPLRSAPPPAPSRAAPPPARNDYAPPPPQPSFLPPDGMDDLMPFGVDDSGSPTMSAPPPRSATPPPAEPPAGAFGMARSPFDPGADLSGFKEAELGSVRPFDLLRDDDPSASESIFEPRQRGSSNSLNNSNNAMPSPFGGPGIGEDFDIEPFDSGEIPGLFGNNQGNSRDKGARNLGLNAINPLDSLNEQPFNASPRRGRQLEPDVPLEPGQEKPLISQGLQRRIRESKEQEAPNNTIFQRLAKRRQEQEEERSRQTPADPARAQTEQTYEDIVSYEEMERRAARPQTQPFTEAPSARDIPAEAFDLSDLGLNQDLDDEAFNLSLEETLPTSPQSRTLSDLAGPAGRVPSPNFDFEPFDPTRISEEDEAAFVPPPRTPPPPVFKEQPPVLDDGELFGEPSVAPFTFDQETPAEEEIPQFSFDLEEKPASAQPRPNLEVPTFDFDEPAVREPIQPFFQERPDMLPDFQFDQTPAFEVPTSNGKSSQIPAFSLEEPEVPDFDFGLPVELDRPSFELPKTESPTSGFDFRPTAQPFSQPPAATPDFDFSLPAENTSQSPQGRQQVPQFDFGGTTEPNFDLSEIEPSIPAFELPTEPPKVSPPVPLQRAEPMQPPVATPPPNGASNQKTAPLSAPPASQGTVAAGQDSLQLANNLFEQKDYNQAITHFNAAIKAADAGSLGQLAERLKQIVNQPGVTPRYHRLLGDVYKKQGQFQAALTEYSKALGPVGAKK